MSAIDELKNMNNANRSVHENIGRLLAIIDKIEDNLNKRVEKGNKAILDIKYKLDENLELLHKITLNLTKN